MLCNFDALFCLCRIFIVDKDKDNIIIIIISSGENELLKIEKLLTSFNI